MPKANAIQLLFNKKGIYLRLRMETMETERIDYENDRPST